MKDNRPTEDLAEHVVKIKLHQANIKHAKPAFDQQGADLIILDDINQKFSPLLKVQVKYRTIGPSKTNNIVIDKTYVTENFICFLYLADEERNGQLYVFFPDDFSRWSEADSNYTLILSLNKISVYQNNLWDENTGKKINRLLKSQPIKKYTSIIIDGIFLRQAMQITYASYEDAYPNIRSRKPSIEQIVKQLLCDYNRYPDNDIPIQAFIFISDDFPLDEVISLPQETHFSSELVPNVKFHIRPTSDLLMFDVMEHLDRTINAENIILVANDQGYEWRLQEIQDKGVDIILLTANSAQGRQIFVNFRWGDIVYPLAKTLGVTEI